MPPADNQTKSAKFTRGEKCIFIHLIITFSILMLFIIIYIVHLFLVKHTTNDIFTIYRRAYDKELKTKRNIRPIYQQEGDLDITNYEAIGVVYLNTTKLTVVCNTLLLKERWSLAPAQCTSMRADPDMSTYLFLWIIKYKISGKYIQSDIKRTLSHSLFNRGDYQNNIGLFEHVKPIFINSYYIVPQNIRVNDETFERYSKRMAIVDWDIKVTKKGDISVAIINRVRPISSDKCRNYARPIVEKLRDYEFCVNFQDDGPVADHGAMVVVNSKIIGFFSWGDNKGSGIPLFILNIIHFKEWIESIVWF